MGYPRFKKTRLKFFNKQTQGETTHKALYANKNGGTAREYPPELLAFIYDEMCADYKVEVLYNTTLIGAKTSAGKISEVIIHTVEGLRAINAKIFIDATGDAFLSRYAGVPTEKGSEHTGFAEGFRNIPARVSGRGERAAGSI